MSDIRKMAEEAAAEWFPKAAWDNPHRIAEQRRALAGHITRHLAPLEPNARLRAAAQLTVLHFKRNKASGNFQGDDEHEAWSALETALAAAPEPKEEPMTVRCSYCGLWRGRDEKCDCPKAQRDDRERLLLDVLEAARPFSEVDRGFITNTECDCGVCTLCYLRAAIAAYDQAKGAE